MSGQRQIKDALFDMMRKRRREEEEAEEQRRGEGDADAENVDLLFEGDTAVPPASATGGEGKELGCIAPAN
jgi:hypothetical protein